MDQIPENPARAGLVGDVYQECVQELQQPYPDYAKIQALATLSLAESLRENGRAGGRAQPRDHPQIKTLTRVATEAPALLPGLPET